MTDPHVIQDQSDVAAFLADPRSHGGAQVTRIETHGAMVFLADDRAYKIKKAVRYPYMDFSTLALREAACKAELSLNRRTAPDIYLRADAICRDRSGRFTLGQPGPGLEAVDWCVVMRRFRQDALFDSMAQRGTLTADHIERLAEEVAAFHGSAEHRRIDAEPAMRWVVEENVQELREQPDLFAGEQVTRLERLALSALETHGPLLNRRAEAGFVRHCHGDLHLRNVVDFGGRPTIFDAIEFNEDLAVVDVFYDLAFLLMDLDHCRMRPLGNRVLNRYLEQTRDYGGLATLPLFLSTRAAVRAKVSASIADAMAESEDKRAGVGQFRRLARDYLVMAIDYLDPPPAELLAIGGLSGSGKSTIARRLAPDLGPAPGAVILRSDVLRKRRFGVGPLDRLPDAAYAQATTEAVYGDLVQIAGQVLEAGHAAIADAVFARPDERVAIAEAAGDAPFDGTWLAAPTEILRERVGGRAADASDADARIVEMQAGFDLGAMDWRAVDASGDVEAVARSVRRPDIRAPRAAAGREPVDAGQ